MSPCKSAEGTWGNLRWPWPPDGGSGTRVRESSPPHALTARRTQNKYTESEFITLLKRQQVPPDRGSVTLHFSRIHLAGI